MPRLAARLAASLLTVLVATPALAPSASAAEGEVIPFVTCVLDSGMTDVDHAPWIIVWGYENTGDQPITIAKPSTNFVMPGARDRGQPSVFAPGRHEGAFTSFAVGSSTVSWVLLGPSTQLASVARHGGPSCGDVTRTELSAPTTATAGAEVTVVASVRSFVAPEPTSGTVELQVDGRTVASAPLDAAGTARFELPVDGSGTRSLTADFVPEPGTTWEASSASAAIDVTDPGTIGLGDVTVSEASAQVTVTRSSASGTARVDWTTADGTATAGEDYTSSSGTVTFDDGQDRAVVSVPLAPRATGAGTEQLFVLLQRASTSVGAAAATVTLPAGSAAPGGDDGGAPGGDDGGAPGDDAPDDGDDPSDVGGGAAGPGGSDAGGVTSSVGPGAASSTGRAGTTAAQGWRPLAVLAESGVRPIALLAVASACLATGAALALGRSRRCRA